MSDKPIKVLKFASPEERKAAPSAPPSRANTATRAVQPAGYAEQMALIRGIRRDDAPLLEALAKL